MRKLADVEFIQYVNNFDILLFNETWLTKNDFLSLDIQGYCCEHIFGNKSAGVKKGRYSGGLSIYYKNCLKDKIKVVEKNQAGIIWLRILKDTFSFNQDVYICATYIPPSGSKVLRSEDIDIFEQLELDIIKYRRLGKIFLTGDFNCRTANEPDYLDFDRYLDDEDNFISPFVLQPRVNKDHVVDSHGRRLLLLCQSSGLLMANGRVHDDCNNGEHTFMSFNGLSVVDYLLANSSDLEYLSNFRILDFNEFSDHAPLFFSFLLRMSERESRAQENPRAKLKIVYDESQAAYFRLELMNNNEVLQRLTECVNNNGPVNSIVDSFTDYMYTKTALVYGKEIFTKNNPNIQFCSNNWFNEECSEAKKEFKQARNSFLRHKSVINRQRFIAMRTKYNRIKCKAKQKYKIKEGLNICDMAKKQPKKFWKTLRKKFKTKSRESETLTADELMNHFKTVFGNDNEILKPHPPAPTSPQQAPPASQQPQSTSQPDPTPTIHPQLDTEITENELRDAVFHQKNGKSPGLDNLPSEIFKISYDIISPFLLKLYNRLFQNGEYPYSWGEGIICPIFKSGDVDKAENYRGITLINIMAKIYSQILLNRLTTWSEKETKISQNQFGFQKGKSTVDCIFTFYSIISKTLHKGEKLYCTFIDYEKAFDKVDRALLWQKLVSENISSKLVKAISSMYSVVKSCIRYRSSYSNFITSDIGLKQGDPSSPLMFMLFINDITLNINSDFDSIFTIDELQIYMLLYADDAVVFAKSPEKLQSILKDVEAYCKTWGLKINTSKTKAMIFEKGRHTSFDFFLNDTRLELVTSFKYLGIHFFKNGNWARTQKRIAEHASHALHSLFSLFKQIELPVSEKCKLFDTFVGSILNYSAEVWGTHDGKDVELIHTKFCRWILHVRKSTNLSGLYGELGRVPFNITRKIRMIIYWIKLLNLQENALPRRIYSMLKNDAENNISYRGSNWAYHIKSLLDELGLSYIWQQQTDIAIPFNLIRQRILDSYYQSWYANINNSNRLQMYSRYKHNFQIENYLDFIYEKKFKTAFTKFRLSSHDLAIERGRYENIPRDERICKNCNLNMVENEFHFLLVCPKYRDLRRKYLKRYYCQWPTLNKFDDLMSKTSKPVIMNLAKFLYFAMKLRDIV